MTPFAQLSLLVRCALGNEPDPVAAIAAAGIDGKAVLRLALQHRIAPYLAGLAADPAIGPVLPRDLRGLLATVRDANAERNARLLRQVEEALALLNRAGIEPVLLKGAARLADGVHDDIAARFMQDLDFLIPRQRLEDAARILRAAGYRPVEPADPNGREHHHLPGLWHEQVEASIELHREVAGSRWRHLLPTDDFIIRSTAIPIGGCVARLPAPSDSLVHLAVHGLLAHARLLKGSLLLSEVVECVLLVRRAGNAALTEASARASEAGGGLAFAAFLHTSELITHEPLRVAGQVAGAQGVAGRLLGLRAVWQQDSRMLRIAGYVAWAATTLRHNPDVRQHFPGRLAQAAFYGKRWQEIRSLLRH
ncbi:MAG: nucleotidyltransferase family protein [Pseudochelatococcus sp.]|jgi:hypothetical protein|uniref:nucleotidyltransferase domain-containing protein n=1 Tax=Pseudochelatococcus sp. TaxID=2020869 RepID=UPI003D8A752C